MTGRERLTNIINLKPADRVSWTTLADDYTRSVMPESIRNLSMMDFYRYIGCDILQFGNFGFTDETQGVKYPYRLMTPEIKEVETYIDENGCEVRKRKTKWGDLIGIYKKGHPIKYAVQNIEDIQILTKIWMSSCYAADEEGCKESYEKMDRLIGSDGIFIPTSEPSPIQSLLEFEMGVENFYYLLYDYKDEMDELISVMNHVKMQEYRIIADKMPYSACIPVENTSTTYISPAIYREYCIPFMSGFVSLMHENNKKAILHMCGHLNNLLPELKETGLDGIHALTPKPIGDTDFDAALDLLGEKLIIVGCLDSTVFQSPTATPEDIKALLDRTVTPRLRESNYVLWAVADGLPTPIEKFLAIRDWMEKNSFK